ncbi:MAG: NUDIX hydrolase [Aeromicrobium sp.]|uniref:NUDIX hydrolase n=1 Tax=Aeromicrobium sp. TaxID=1871063 RepID=UPI0039E5DF7E
MGPLHADAAACLSGWTASDAAQESLRQDYLRLLADRPDAMWRTCHPDHLTASVLVFSADLRRVALTLHAKAGLWLQTGGHCEPDDRTLAGAALREGAEETGVDGLSVDPVPVLLSRHEVPFCGPVQPAHHLDVQFVAVAPPDARLTVSEESADLAWFAVDDLPVQTDEAVRRLVSSGGRRLRGSL